MKTNHIFWTICAAACLAFSACTDELKSDEPAIHNIEVVSESVFDVGYCGEIIYVQIDANCQWTINKTDNSGNEISWIKTDVASGKGQREFNIKVLTNNTAEKRSGVVNIYSDQVTAYIDITQERNPYPGSQPGVFKGYSLPVYQMMESNLGMDTPGGTVQEQECDFSNLSVEGNFLIFHNGLIVEKSGDTDASWKMLCPSYEKPESYAGFQLGVSASFGQGEGWIFKIPMNFEVSGDLRFTYGARNDGISSGDTSPYHWSSDEGKTWNNVTRMEEIASNPAFKSVWFTVPEAQKVNKESMLWIKVDQNSGRPVLQNGIALEKAEVALSQLPSQDNSTIIISEGFDSTVGAVAASVETPGYMKSATTGFVSGGIDTNPYKSPNKAISVSHCFARAGFLQVGYSDESYKEQCGWNGSVVIKIGERLKEMGFTESTGLKVSFKAAGMTNAFGVKADGRLVIMSDGVVLTGVDRMSADKFSEYELTIPEVDQNTVLTITSAKSAKTGDGKASSSYESADYRFFIDDLLIESVPVVREIELAFDFTDPEAMSRFPTSNTPEGYVTEDIIECPYTLNGIDYVFYSANPTNASGPTFPRFDTAKNYFGISKYRCFGLPVVPGMKLTKVVVTTDRKSTFGVSEKRGNKSSAPKYVEGGEAQEFVAGDCVFELTATTPDTGYWICPRAAVGVLGVTLTYTR